MQYKLAAALAPRLVATKLKAHQRSLLKPSRESWRSPKQKSYPRKKYGEIIHQTCSPQLGAMRRKMHPLVFL